MTVHRKHMKSNTNRLLCLASILAGTAIIPTARAAEGMAAEDEPPMSKSSATGAWNREAVRRCVLDGGGTEEFFEHGFAELLEKFAQEQQAISAGTFHAAGGGMTYLVSGRKS